jgi:hypothetical protein
MRKEDAGDVHGWIQTSEITKMNSTTRLLTTTYYSWYAHQYPLQLGVHRHVFGATQLAPF